MTSKDFRYRCRLCVELYNDDDLEKHGDRCVPFKIVPLLDLNLDAEIAPHYHETDTDRGVMSEQTIEVQDVRHTGEKIIDRDTEFMIKDIPGQRLRGFVRGMVWDSLEYAIDKCEATEVDDVNMEADG